MTRSPPVELLDVAFALALRDGLETQRAFSLARSIAVAMDEQFGGTAAYWPRLDTLEARDKLAARAHELRAAGLTVRQIARKLGTSKSAVDRLLRLRGVPPVA